MEGVIVSAKKDGSTITVKACSATAKARYSFPADRLSPGRYSLQIRAARGVTISKVPTNGGGHRGPAFRRRPQAAQDKEPEQAAHQCRMDD